MATIRYLSGDGSGRTTTQTATVGQTITLPTENFWARTGYTLNRWRNQNTGIDYYPREAYTVTGDTTFVTVWQPISYSVRFYANDGTSQYITQPGFFYGQGTALAPNQYTRSGYIFKGWNRSSGGTTVQYEDKEVVYDLGTIADETVPLYAVWEAAFIRVKYNGQWRQGQVFAKVNGQWRQGQVFVKDNGTWKEGQ
jgi:hypothetical protein